MISPLTRRQLIAFVIVSILGIGVMAVRYIQIPQMLGVGRYTVAVDLPAAGGLYSKAEVTYRGQEVGVVRSLALRSGGVRATLQIDDGIAIPADARVHVRSSSAIGEQYVDFVPGPASRTSRVLRAGDVVPASQADVPISTGVLLQNVNSLLASVPLASYRTTVDELAKAFGGTSDDLQRLLDSGMSFQQALDSATGPTKKLLVDLQGVLGTQEQLRDQVRQIASGLDQATGALAANDTTLDQVIRKGVPAAQQVNALVQGLDQPLTMLLQDLDATAPVLKVYIPGIRQVLILLPAAIEAHYADAPPSLKDPSGLDMATLSFKTGVNDPPVCTTGFPDNSQQRSPKDTSLAPLSPNAYCNVPHDDQRVVRGARNNPCPNDPHRYAATAAGCGLVFQPGRDSTQGTGNSDHVATYAPSTGEVLAPNGTFFLIDDLASGTIPATFDDLMAHLVGAS